MSPIFWTPTRKACFNTSTSCVYNKLYSRCCGKSRHFTYKSQSRDNFHTKITTLRLCRIYVVILLISNSFLITKMRASSCCSTNPVGSESTGLITFLDAKAGGVGDTSVARSTIRLAVACLKAGTIRITATHTRGRTHLLEAVAVEIVILFDFTVRGIDTGAATHIFTLMPPIRHRCKGFAHRNEGSYCRRCCDRSRFFLLLHAGAVYRRPMSS